MFSHMVSSESMSATWRSCRSMVRFTGVENQQRSGEMKGLSYVVAGLGLALMVGAAGLRGQEIPEWVTDTNIEAGAAVFAGPGICVACHGADATGTIGPDLTDDDWLHGDGSPASILERILKGVSASEVMGDMGAIMPPKGGSAITDEQAKQVAAYIWSLRHPKGDPSGPAS